MKSTRNLQRHAPTIDLINSNGDDIDVSSKCRKVQFDTEELATAALEAVNQWRRAGYTAHHLKHLDVRVGGDAGVS